MSSLTIILCCITCWPPWVYTTTDVDEAHTQYDAHRATGHRVIVNVEVPVGPACDPSVPGRYFLDNLARPAFALNVVAVGTTPPDLPLGAPPGSASLMIGFTDGRTLSLSLS